MVNYPGYVSIAQKELTCRSYPHRFARTGDSQKHKGSIKPSFPGQKRGLCSPWGAVRRTEGEIRAEQRRERTEEDEIIRKHFGDKALHTGQSSSGPYTAHLLSPGHTARNWAGGGEELKSLYIIHLKTIAVLLCTFLLPALTPAQCDLGRNYAVFFGVADYGPNSGWPDLRYPIDDITSLAQILADDYQFDTILLRNPSKAEIDDQLYALKEKSDWSPNDQLLLFFSGHGAPGYFIPRDGQAGREMKTAIGFNDQFKEFLNDIPCAHELVVMDACYSGSFLIGEDRSGGDGWKKVLLQEERDENLQILCQHLSRKSRLIMTAAAADSKTPDQSQLVKQFKRMLLDWRNADEVLYTGTIYQRLKRESSTPIFDAFHHDSDEASSFVFIPPTIRDRFEKASPCPLDPDLCQPRERSCALCPLDPAQQEYPVVAVGNTLWLTQNLNFDNSGQSACYDCDTYGRLYTWSQAKAACAALGAGWRLPTESEWIQLTKQLGDGYDIPGPGGQDGDPRSSFQKLMDSRWQPVLAGYVQRGKHKAAGKQAYFWTSTPATDEREAVVFWLSQQLGVMKTELEREGMGGCRCVRGE